MFGLKSGGNKALSLSYTFKIHKYYAFGKQGKDLHRQIPPDGIFPSEFYGTG